MTEFVQSMRPNLWLKLDDFVTADGTVPANSGTGYTGKRFYYRDGITGQEGLNYESDGSVWFAGEEVGGTAQWVEEFYDYFNRADGSLGSEWTGSGISVVTNAAQLSTTGTATALVSGSVYSYAADQRVQVTSSGLNSNAHFLMLRGGNIQVSWSINTTLRVTAPSFIDTGISVSQGSTVMAEVVGNALALYLNGTQVYSTTLAATTGGQPGFKFTFQSDTLAGTRIDNFTASDYRTVEWVARATDDFSGGDGSLVTGGPPATGGIWESSLDIGTGELQRVNGQVTFADSGNTNNIHLVRVRPNSWTFGRHQGIECTVSDLSANVPGFLMGLRHIGDLTSFHTDFEVTWQRNSSYRVFRCVNNSFTTLYTGPTAQQGDVIRLDIIGSTLTFTLNGTVMWTGSGGISAVNNGNVLLSTGQPFFGANKATLGISPSILSKADNVVTYELVDAASGAGVIPSIGVNDASQQGCEMGGATQRQGAPFLGCFVDGSGLPDGTVLDPGTYFVVFSSGNEFDNGFDVIVRMVSGVYRVGFMIDGSLVGETNVDPAIGPRFFVGFAFWETSGTNYRVRLWANDASTDFTWTDVGQFPTSMFTIGNKFDDSAQPFVGAVDEVLYWRNKPALNDMRVRRVWHSYYAPPAWDHRPALRRLNGRLPGFGSRFGLVVFDTAPTMDIVFDARCPNVEWVSQGHCVEFTSGGVQTCFSSPAPETYFTSDKRARNTQTVAA